MKKKYILPLIIILCLVVSLTGFMATIWVEVAGKLGDETHIRSLAVYNNKLYGGTYHNGRLY